MEALGGVDVHEQRGVAAHDLGLGVEGLEGRHRAAARRPPRAPRLGPPGATRRARPASVAAARRGAPCGDAAAGGGGRRGGGGGAAFAATAGLRLERGPEEKEKEREKERKRYGRREAKTYTTKVFCLVKAKAWSLAPMSVLVSFAVFYTVD